jgi:hypothetical protein
MGWKSRFAEDGNDDDGLHISEGLMKIAFNSR